MCGGSFSVSNRVWTERPTDPSPTPWNFNTWGFFCDHCMMFFDLVRDGRVETQEGNTCTRYHKCGAEARYIGYDHSVEYDPAKP